jgi:hypothetical protein
MSGAISSTYSYRLQVLTLATGETQTFDVNVKPKDRDPIIWFPKGNWIAFISDAVSGQQEFIRILNLETGTAYCALQEESVHPETIDWQ